MKGAWRLARIAGVDINVHWSFSLVILWILAQGILDQKELPNILFILMAVLLLFVCVMLHELGHAVAALWLRVEVKSITLLPIGGLARIQAVPERPVYEMLITGAGPLTNLVIALLLVPPYLLLNQQPLFSDLFTSPGTLLEATLHSSSQEPAVGLMLFLLLANGILFVFNLIPAFPMDGGRILRAVLALFLSGRAATRIAIAVGQLIGLALILSAFWLRSPVLLLVALVIFLAGLPFRFNRPDPAH